MVSEIEMKVRVLRKLIECEGKNFLEMNKLLGETGILIQEGGYPIEETSLEQLVNLRKKVNAGQVKNQEDLNQSITVVRLELQSELSVVDIDKVQEG